MAKKTQIAAIFALSTILWSAVASAVPTLWGVDEDDGELFRIDDYTNPSGTLTSYGQFKWNDSGTIRTVGNDIEAFTIRSDGMAYMVLDDDISGHNEPVLMRFDMNTASTSNDNVVDVIARIDINFDTSHDDITGIDFDATTGTMYALFEDYNSHNRNRKDRLLEVNSVTGAVISNQIIDDDYYYKKEQVKLGEDMVFHSNGQLLVVDQHDDDLYYVDPDSAQITGLYDGDTDGGLPSSSYFEALAWDAENEQLVAFSDNGNFFALITEGSGGNSSYGGAPGLTDVEGLAFWTPGPTIPVPAPLMLMSLGMLGMLAWRRKR